MWGTSSRWAIAIGFACALAACTSESAEDASVAEDSGSTGGAAASTAQDTSLPAGADDAQARLAESPRHGEWAMIPAGRDSIRAWIVYPERSTPAPVVVVIHEIYGLSHWIRAVADQLAADGFVAIAPDLLTTKNLSGAPADTPAQEATAAIRTLDPADVQRWLDATASYGMALPAATDRYGVVGFCWGGSSSFSHAVHAPQLDAAVVYYGSSPSTDALSRVQAPVLGLYGENDARVNRTVQPADSAMRALGKTFEPHTFAGAGHGFLRSQPAMEGANMAATREAWPLTVAWFRRHLEAR